MATSILSAGRVALDPGLYPKGCVEATATAYAQFLRIEPSRKEAGAPELDIVILPGFSSKGVQLRREFLNYLLDLSVQHHLRG